MRDIPMTLATEGEVMDLATSDGARLSKEQRKDLLEQSLAGKAVTLRMKAQVYHQADKPRPLPASLRRLANLNFVRFDTGEMVALAKSFKGVPFLRDHERGLLAVGGAIVSSELVESDSARGEKLFSIHQEIEIVEPWAVQKALNGTMKAFSIGWALKNRSRSGWRAGLVCTVCDDSYFSAQCSHFPGDEVTVDGTGEKVIVELEWRGVKGSETSAVPFPAVASTRIEDIRAALSAARLTKHEVDMNEIEKLKAQLAQKETELAAEREAHQSARAALDTERATAAATEAARRQAEVAALREQAIASGKWIPGDQRDTLFAQLAADSIERAQKFVAALEPVTPVGSPLASQEPAAPPAPGSPTSSVETVLAEQYGKGAMDAKVLRSQLKQLGLSDEDFLKYGQHSRVEA